MGAQASVSLDFGAYPGSHSAFVDLTGQTGFTAASLAEAWIVPKATADHSADEHRIEELSVFAAYQADGTVRIFGEHNGHGSRSQNGHNLYGIFNIGVVWN